MAQNKSQTIHAQKASAISQLKPIARLAPSNQLSLVMSLPLRNQPALAALLHDLYDPNSPRYRKYLRPSEFAAQFGPTERDYEDVVGFAKSHGLRVTGTHANRTLLDVSGSARDIESAFHARMGVYQHPSEARTFHAPDTEPSVDLSVPILSVQGLDDFELPHPMDLTNTFYTTNTPATPTGSGPSGYFIGGDFRAAYAPGVGLTGTGQSLGLVELDGYYLYDIVEYETLAKLPRVTLTNILVDGFNGTPGMNEMEVALDIDMAISMAPGLSQVLVYEGTNPDDILNRMATDDQANQLSCSWGFPPQIDPAREQIYEQFAAQGQTMFQAAGNDGAYAGVPAPPSDDPNLTVVGGTLLTTSEPGGPWLSETAWSGSGGGISSNFPRPDWQFGLVTAANHASSGYRNIPDVSAVAGVSIWLIAFDGQQGAIGGTSAAAPLWAGFTALANQQAASQGKPPIGFINPTLYSIGRTAKYSENNMSGFHDIMTGNNTNAVSPTNFFAVQGYDLCTGLGTPAGSNLINALVTPPDALQIFPFSGLVASGPQGGPFYPSSETLAVSEIVATNIDWVANCDAPWLSVSPLQGNESAIQFGSVVTLNLTAAANDLPPGTHTATIWFTNLADRFVQSRQFLLNVAVTSSVPVIISQSTNVTALPGATAVFGMTAVGNAPLSYQWHVNTTNLVDGGNISGSSTRQLTITSISPRDAGSYSVTVSNALSSVTSTDAVLTVASVTAPGVTLSVLHSFSGLEDGGNPNGLMEHTNGNFYGTTQSGGTNSSGTIFQVTPDGALTTLRLFDSSDGGGFTPQAGLAQGADGNLYGATENGGTSGAGTVFKTTTNGNLTYLHSFSGGDGAYPSQPMILGSDGNLYGSTSGGGEFTNGEIFSVTPAGTVSQVASFNYIDGLYPNKLTQGVDGNLYGTTFDGGTNGDGVIFEVTADGTLTSLYSFAFFIGGFLPEGGLTQTAEGNFYGTTLEGGAFGEGTIFTMSPSGAVTTLYSFTGGNDGAQPAADLIQATDGNLYGTTFGGGPYKDGTLFRWAPGSSPITLVSFDGYNGENPETPLVQGTDGNFYGTTQNGGAGGDGVVFRVNINSTSVKITGQPAGQSAYFGADAVFSVAFAGNPPLFFQWTKNGMNLTDGGNISGSRSRVLSVSDVSATDSAIYSVTVSNAAGSTATSDGAFLGVILSPPRFATPLANQTASVGGSASFTANVVGNLPLYFQWQSNKVNLTNGANVSGATTSVLTLSGLTQRSGATYSVIVSNAIGTVSAAATLVVNPVSAPGTLMESVYWFTGGDDGATPNGLTLGSSGILYGTTQVGGAHNDGTVFSVTTNGVFQTLASFDGTNGSTPMAALAQGADGNFYGATPNGGANGGGTVFVVTTNGVLTTLADFTNSNNINPYLELAQGSNGNFYGAAQNNAMAGDGNIFEISLAGQIDVLHSFAGGGDGNEPIGALTQSSDGSFYGMTTAGGEHNFGGIFRMTPDGEVTNLYSFSGGADGYNPYGALVEGADGDFYGVTRRNVIQGVPFDGTIFKISPSGALTTLYALNPLYNGDGEYPFAGLTEGADGNFYGTTLYSESTINGTLFRVTPDGAYATLAIFNGSDDGAQPKAAMVQDSAGNFYGTTTSGGPYGKGSIFRMSVISAPQITMQPSGQTKISGSSADFSVAVSGASPLAFQWKKNGAGLIDGGSISGSATRVLTINNLSNNDAGTYSVVVTNSLGSVTSSGAILSILGEAPVIQSVTQIAGMISFTWSASQALSYQLQSTTNLAASAWTNVGAVLTATNSTLSASYPSDSASQQFYRVLLLP